MRSLIAIYVSMKDVAPYIVNVQLIGLNLYMSFLDSYPVPEDKPVRPVGPNLIGEPVVRPDGKLITLHDSGHGSLFVHVDGTGFFYSEEEVLRMGNGDVDAGYRAIGRIAYEADAATSYDIYKNPSLDGQVNESE